MTSELQKLYGLLSAFLETPVDNYSQAVALCPRLFLSVRSGGHWEATVNADTIVGNTRSVQFTARASAPCQETAVLRALLEHLRRARKGDLDFTPRGAMRTL